MVGRDGAGGRGGPGRSICRRTPSAPTARGGPRAWASIAAAIFRAVDANRDGRVTPEEVRPAVDARFRALDVNGDNGVTPDELPLRHRGRHHGHPHFGRPDAPPPPPPR
jgi:EF hand domain-containing protein